MTAISFTDPSDDHATNVVIAAVAVLRHFVIVMHTREYYCWWQSHRLSSIQRWTLNLIASSNTQLNKAELAKELGVRNSTISESTNALLAKGLIKESDHPYDERMIMLNLTHEGLQCVEDLGTRKDMFVPGLEYGLTPDEQRALHAIVIKMIVTLKSRKR